MKKLSLITKQYQDIVTNFRAYLRTKNYSESSQYHQPHHVQEFLHFLEQRNTKLNDWQPADFKDFTDRIKQRSHDKKGGGLSNAHINKIIQALHLLQSYLGAVDKLDFYVKLPFLESLKTEMQIFTKI